VETRLKFLNNQPVARGNYILYWMQQSQRAEWNHALEYALYRANDLDLPLLVCFGLNSDYPLATARHYRFMLEGLKETAKALEEKGVKLVVRIGNPPAVTAQLAEKAALTITDCGYLRLQRQWRQEAASKIKCPLIQVESDVIVPVEEASAKEDYTAGTFRPKILRQLHEYLQPLKAAKAKRDSLGLNIESENCDDISGLMLKLNFADEDNLLDWIHGGTGEAKKRLEQFIENKLDRVPDERNDPAKNCVSRLSPYLHFGQISPIFVALAIRESGSRGSDIFLEELIVRRELAMNFVYYNPNYDSLTCLPDWALISLKNHADDRREYLYSLADLEAAQTHDQYWNAAQKELLLRGHMHGYMRMYWGKKILEWSPSPREAFQQAVYLNDRYSLDGRDPNGYAGVAWCFGKHDRAWGERPVFGKVRYMNEAGLRRKFDIDSYVEQIEAL